MPLPSDIALAFDDLRISAHCGLPSHREWLREFLVPDFSCVDGEGDCAVHIVADSSRYERELGDGPADDAALLDCFALDSSVVRLPILRRDGSATTVFDAQFDAVYEVEPDERRVTILSRPTSIRVRASLLRIVREFAMNHLHSRGLFLHASAIAIGSGGIAFAGRKAAGKTTFLTYLLSHGTARYVSNDRVFVGDEGDRPVLRNIPTVISVRPGTLELCPEFGDRFLHSGFTTYLTTLAESMDREDPVRPNQFGNYFLSPAQYRKLFEAPQQPQVRASALVFPIICADVETFKVRRLVSHEALARLPDALLGSGGWRKGADALTIPGAAPAPDRGALAARSERFCHSVRCYEIRLGKKAFADGSLASAIHELAD